MFHMMIFRCNNLMVDSVKINAPGNSPNTDGIHISLCNNIIIKNTKISTGDDCISIGQTNRGLSITNVICGPGHGISVGSLGKYNSDKDVSDIMVSRCNIKGTTNGVRIKTWQKSYPLTCRNFTFQNIKMDNVLNPIIIDQEYCPYGNGRCGGQSTSSQVSIRDVTYDTIKGSSASQVAINLKCSKSHPCKNLRFRNVNLKYNRGTTQSTCLNVANPNMNSVYPLTCKR